MNLINVIVVFTSITTAIQQQEATDAASLKPTDYKTAYQRAQSGDKPLLVLVTATWCPPCQQLKNSTLPEMMESNGFKDFHFAVLDVDDNRPMAEQLVENRPIPQFIIFEKKNDSWTRRYLVGYNSVAEVTKFLQPSIKTLDTENGSPEIRTADATAAGAR